jgi:hypothetical protein
MLTNGSVVHAVSDAEGVRTIVPGGAIVRFLSRVGTLETSSAIDRTGECDRSQLQKGPLQAAELN